MRGNVKSKSHAEAKAQWKDKIGKGYLEHAKVSRKKRLQNIRALQHGDDDGRADVDGLDGHRYNGFNNYVDDG